MVMATANHASAAMVVAFAVGLPALVVGLSALAAIFSGGSHHGE